MGSVSIEQIDNRTTSSVSQINATRSTEILTLGNGQGWTPLVSQNIQADTTVAVDVRVIDTGCEVDLGRLEGVVCGEMDGEEENTSGVWRITLWAREKGSVRRFEGCHVKDRMTAFSLCKSEKRRSDVIDSSICGMTYGSHNCSLPVKL